MKAEVTLGSPLGTVAMKTEVGPGNGYGTIARSHQG